VLIPVAHFGDKNEAWTKRLIGIAFVASLIFIIALLYYSAPSVGVISRFYSLTLDAFISVVIFG
jgi:type IV secretory pathway VirB6-like protein